ncbi:MAG: formylmethanofuran dehydrogenase subunit A [Candidatus Hadarchaeales archaeon]
MIIKNGTVYDPLNGIKGEKMDLFIEDGKIVEEARGEVIDASGMIVFPGGVDLHSHIAGSKVNLGRLMRPEDHRRDPVPRTEVTRSGTGYTVPTTYVTGYRYAILGYTTVMEAAMPPLTARHVHEELCDIPMVDKGAYTLMGNNHFVMKYIAEGNWEKLRNYVGWLLKATKGYAIKLVNPGGVENWKWGKNVEGLDDGVENYGVTPREIIKGLSRVNEELGLPHPIHVHCNKLGTPGKFGIVIDTVKTVVAQGGRVHITHIQFNSYGGENWATLSSAAPEVAKAIDESPNATCDLGQVIFGEATTMTADGPWQYNLFKLTGNKWYNSDVEMEVGAGIVPYTFKPKSLVNAVQWTIGLEVALLVKDPWKVVLTTDHPNAGPFYHYPKVIEWLMSKRAREKTLSEIHRAASSRSTLPSLDREYSLYEIAIVTRAGPAKLLGLKRKGHLGVGADADVAIYEFKEEDIEGSFSRAKYVIKDGEVVVKDGKVVKEVWGRTFWVSPTGELPEDAKQDFEKYYTVSLENYPVELEYLPKSEVIPCR